MVALLNRDFMDIQNVVAHLVEVRLSTIDLARDAAPTLPAGPQVLAGLLSGGTSGTTAIAVGFAGRRRISGRLNDEPRAHGRSERHHARDHRDQPGGFDQRDTHKPDQPERQPERRCVHL